MDTHVENVPLHETARERYLNYALSVITSRALPDVRDGLKPVQRRILYGLHQLRLTPDSRHRKSAQVVGHVMGHYHPHGDSAIYDAMVRMAQPFSLRNVLVDGQGNFGSLDGDQAAAMRYTEARMAPLATQMLDDLSDRLVPFRPTYDASREEPAVLAAGFPNLLVNGATGIAVGMATNIPPHNLGEVIDACVAMIDEPDVELDGLLELMKGPDFPTGGRILNRAEKLRKIYETGRGAIEMRGDYELEKEGRRRHIVVTSIPYMTDKSQLVERIADHIRGNKLPQIVDVRDESTDDVRVVLDLKRGADPEAAMAYLFKHTPLQSRFHVNLTCLVPIEDSDDEAAMRPKRCGLPEILRHFLDFRFDVVTRRLEVQLEKLEDRIHILEGFAKIFDALDEAIALIRSARDRKDASERLQSRFGLDERQADAILEIRLYRLARMEIEKILSELDTKRAEAAHIRGLLDDASARWELVRSELLAVKQRFGDPRRTVIAGPDEKLSYSREDYIVDEDVFVILTEDGWLKRQRSYTDISTIRIRDGDAVRWVLFGSTRRTVIFFSDRGRSYTMRINAVPATTGYGEPVQAHFDFEDGEYVVGAIVADPRVLPRPVPDPEEETAHQRGLFDEDGEGESEDHDETEDDGESEDDDAWVEDVQFIAVTRAGQSVRMKLENYLDPSTVAGRLFMRLQEPEDFPGDRVLGVKPLAGDELVSIATHDSRAMTFAAHEVSQLKGPGKGVMAISLTEGDHVIGFALAGDEREGLEVETVRGRRVVISPRRYTPVSRASRGRLILQRGHLAEVHYPVVELEPPSDDDETDDDDDAQDTDSEDQSTDSEAEPADSGNEPAGSEDEGDATSDGADDDDE